MRVLWFTGVQLPALKNQGLTRARWQEELRASLESNHPELELGIATFHSQPMEPVRRGNATYLTLHRQSPSGRLGRTWQAWQHKSFSDAEYRECIDLVHKFKPDVIHFHGSENFFGLICREISVPSVLSIQGIISRCVPYFFTDLSWREILQQFSPGSFLRGRGLIHKWWSMKKYCGIEAQILKACRNFIGRTEWDGAVIQAVNPQSNYFHCDEPLAGIFYTAQWQPASSAKQVIYSTSSGVPFKGSLMLVHSMAVLRERGWKNVELHLAGINPDFDAGKLIVDYIQEQHLEDRVHLHARLDPEQIVGKMLQSSLYVHSSHMDNSPNSLCEAMLIGMPCIASRVGGVPSLVREGIDGFLYHDRDVCMLADRIIQILSDPNLASRLGQEARNTALLRHDRKKIAARMVEIYQQVLSRPGQG